MTGHSAKLEIAKGKLRQAIWDLKNIVVGQDTTIYLVVAAFLAREHIALVGPPGEGKTYAAQNLVHYIDGASTYYHLMTRFTVPDEVFGAHSIKELTENDRLVRNTQGKAPHAQIVILDEVFKANSPMLNALLGLMNERKFEGVDCKLQTMVGVSNEWPRGISSVDRQGDDESLAPLWDRFLFRYEVKPLRYESDLVKLLTCACPTQPNSSLAIDEEHVELLQWEVDRMARQLSKEVAGTIIELRQRLRQKGINVSTRRWVKAVRAMAASALLGDRSKITTGDIKILANVLWSEPDHRTIVKDAIYDLASPEEALADSMFQSAFEATQTLRTLDQGSTEWSAGVLAMLKDIKGYEKELAAVLSKMEKNGEDTSAVKTVVVSLREIATEYSQKLMGGL